MKSILTRLSNTHHERDVEHTLNQLVREDLISHDQYESLMALDKMDLPAVIEIVKDTKIGQGLTFLPRVRAGLKQKLPFLLEEMVKTGHTRVKKELEGVLEELLRRDGITHHKYQGIKDEHNIL